MKWKILERIVALSVGLALTVCFVVMTVKELREPSTIRCRACSDDGWQP